ncbi:MAG: S9A/B/C family peptidase [Hyphomonadaceae bacterium]|nr:MAG: S9A/B/C family peptidase [Hyphomonadaceae bacterium]KAF0184886.1 MAG: S9A/B/C family peptidase [Hyphomonadaceae bacterium]
MQNKYKARATIVTLTTLAMVVAPNIILAQAAPQAEIVRRTQGALVMENVPITPDNVRERLIQYNNVRAAGFAGFAPDGSILISTRFAETSQIHAVSRPMGARYQLTYYPEQIGGVSTIPKSNNFIFTKDRGGDEFFQYHLFNRATGTTTQLTEAGTRNESRNISRDGKMMAWSVSRSGSSVREIVVMNIAEPSSKRVVYRADGAWFVADFSPDGRKLLIGQSISVTQSKRAILDIASGVVTPITPNLRVSYDGGQFSPDGRFIYLGTDENSDFAYGVKIELATGRRTRVTPNINWDVEGISLSQNGQNLAYVVNEEGRSKLYLLPTTQGARAAMIALPTGVVGGLEWSDDSQKLGLALSTSSAPSDAYVYTLASRSLIRWTRSEIGGLNPATFVEPRLIRYPTFDEISGQRRTIPAWVYEPKTPGPHPVIIQIHGGPEGQSRPNFSSTIQYWVNDLGATVIVPNVRGSTGYGKAYVDLDNGSKRMDSVKDIGSLLDWIGTQANMNKNKVAVYGGSYGGFMVLASMTNYNDRLAGGVDIVGISSLVTFLENTQGYRRDLRRVEYGDERDPAVREFMTRTAPLTNAGNINRPLFVIQGHNDPRVPQSEAEQIVARVRANGVNVWYMLGMDEGHGFAKKSNRDAQREAETLFFREIFGN